MLQQREREGDATFIVQFLFAPETFWLFGCICSSSATASIDITFKWFLFTQPKKLVIVPFVSFYF